MVAGNGELRIVSQNQHSVACLLEHILLHMSTWHEVQREYAVNATADINTQSGSISLRSATSFSSICTPHCDRWCGWLTYWIYDQSAAISNRCPA